jgi:ATP-dependent DNA ligase
MLIHQQSIASFIFKPNQLPIQQQQQQKQQWLVYVIFDIVYVDGVDAGVNIGNYSGSLTGVEYRHRWGILSRVIQPYEKWVEVLEQQLVQCNTTSLKARNELLTKRLDEVIANRGEGLVIKDLSSLYMVGSREPVWIKLKPNHTDNIGEPMVRPYSSVVTRIENQIQC